MAATQNISVRVDAGVKAEAEEILSELGLPTATAINIFLKSIIRYRGLPLDMRLARPKNSEIIAEPIGGEDDPFYAEANMAYLEDVAARINAGTAKLTEHELIEVD